MSPPDLTSTGTTFADWLIAREKLHYFFTGETINLSGLFLVNKELLNRKDIMPIFRPAGATNRMAMDWKEKLGIVVWEYVDVMQYKNSEGPKIPELYYINRSLKPDGDTLSGNAASPNSLVEILFNMEDTTKSWTNLYGYSDADNLYFSITGKHLDSNRTWFLHPFNFNPNQTLTWHPDDRLSSDHVALSGWLPPHYGGVCLWSSKFLWSSCVYSAPYIGARLATSIPIRKEITN